MFGGDGEVETARAGRRLAIELFRRLSRDKLPAAELPRGKGWTIWGYIVKWSVPIYDMP